MMMMVCASERAECSLHSGALFVCQVSTVHRLPGDNRCGQVELRAIITGTGPSTRISFSRSSIKTLTVENRKAVSPFLPLTSSL